MKKPLYYFLLLVLAFQAHACIVPERVQAVTQTLSERHQMYQGRQRASKACAVAAGTLFAAWVAYSWYSQPTGAQLDLKSFATDREFVDFCKKFVAARNGAAQSSWLWRHANGFGVYLGQMGVMTMMGECVRQAAQYGNAFLYPRVTRTLMSSAYLTDMHGPALDAEPGATVSVSRDVDFFITHVDMVDYAVRHSDQNFLQEAAHGVLGCIDYVTQRMEHDTESSPILVREITQLRVLLAQQLEELYTAMSGEPRDSVRIEAVHQQFCATARKLCIFELLRV